MSNYFEVGLSLINELESKAKEWGIKKVGTAAHIRGINMQTTPAIYVINTGNTPTANGSHDSRDTQQWTVVVGVSHQAAQRSTSELMSVAGELISKVVNHVQGFEIDDYHEPLERTSTSGQPEYFGTFALYPFTFQTKFQP